MNEITIIQDAAEVRQAFTNKFTLSWDEFCLSNREWIENAAKSGYTVDYEGLYLWELMNERAISFADALSFLRSLNGDVYLMSESEKKPNAHGFTLDGVEYKGIVARADARALADLIEYEWNEGWRLMDTGYYLADTVLPEDLYVFDEAMEHLLVFTHESDFWELELTDPMRCAASRYCMMHGFDLPMPTEFESIRSILRAELAYGSSLEVEMSFSIPGFYRRFIITKGWNDDRTDCCYWFDFDAETDYPSLDDAEHARVFVDMSLLDISRVEGCRFDVIGINGNEVKT